MTDYDPYAEVADGRTWSSERAASTTALILEPTLAASAYVEVSVYVDGDGPSASLLPATARQVGLAILDRAALLERGTGRRTISAEENVVRGEAALRATGHDVTGDFDRDLDRAIDLERQRREQIEEGIAGALGIDDVGPAGETLNQRHDRLVAAARVAAEAVDGTAAFHAAEADYWRLEAQTLAATVRAALDALGGAAGPLGYREPPEPPVGTRYLDPDDDMRVAWHRGADGWHCGGPDDQCRTCPVPWSEVWQWHVGVPARTRRERKYGETARPLVRRLGDGHVVDAELAEDLPESATVDMPRCPTCTSTAPHLHPAVQLGGEVELCADPWHAQITPENTPERRAAVERLLESRLDWTRVPAAPDAGEVTPW